MTNEKRRLSLIPVFVILAILIVIYFVFLKDTNLLKLNREPEVRRINGFPTIVYTDKQVEKERLIITDAQQLSDFLNRIDESGYLIMREEIDFDKEMLLAVSSSTNDYEGVEIKIRKLYEDKEKNKLLVSVREIEPGESCERLPNKNVSVDLVAISNTLREIEFERVKEITECN